MLEALPYQLIRKHLPATAHSAVCLGDQKPAFGSGFKSIGEQLGSLGLSRTLTLDYDGRADILHNLNFPLPSEYHGVADVVYDGGTSEHVANVGESLTTMVRLPRLGGLICQVVPLNCYGGAYYGLDPLLLHDFYRANGFEQKELLIEDNENWRYRCIQIATRILPAQLVEWCRLRLQRTSVGKTFVLAETVAKLYPAAPAYAFDGKFNNVPVFRNVPLLSNAVYVGVKQREVNAITWPAQRNYPSL